MAWFLVLLFLDAQVNLLTVNGHFLGRIDPDSHLITLDAQHGYGDFTVTNNQTLRAPTGQNQHTYLLNLQFRDNSLHKPKGTSLSLQQQQQAFALSIDQRRKKNSFARLSET